MLDRVQENSVKNGTVRLQGFLPYALLGLVCLLCHGVLLLNDGPIWDGWYVVEWLTSARWRVLLDFFDSVGMPLFGSAYRLYPTNPGVISHVMLATFLCLLANSILVYHLAIRLTLLPRGESLCLAALSQAIPVFNAAQEFIMFLFLATETVFLLSALVITRAMVLRNGRRWGWMVLGIVGFWFSFSNAALLVFYGAFYVFLFIRFGKTPGTPLLVAGRRFVLQHPFLFLLPPVNWFARGWLAPQYGWYSHYNSPLANIGKLGTNLWSFFQNVPWFHIRASFGWAGDHPLLVVLLVAGIIAWWVAAPKRWNFAPGPLATRHLVWSGFLLLFLAIFPFAAAGKHFSVNPVSSESHHFFLVGLPVSILLYAAMRGAICYRHRAQFGRIAMPVVGCSAVFLGSQLFRYYVAEQAEWVFSRSLLHNATRNEVVRASSVLLLQRYSLVQQPSFGIYAFATAFGGLTRFVTSHPPENQRFYSPSEIGRTLLRTTMLANEFNRINPAGQQLLIVAERNRGAATDWDIVWRYQMLRWFGTDRELDELLNSLCTLQTGVIKADTPLTPAQAPVGTPEEPSLSGIPSGDFVNAAGMRMVFVPWGWWAGKFEVTQRQYERVMAANPSLFKDPLRPVECVSWNDASDFCRRLTDLEQRAGRLPSGFLYRLPSVQEFDQIAAGGSLRDAVTSAQELRWHTAPVGSQPATSLGLHDVVGNVWEWCLDWGDDAKRFRISAGGAWPNHDWELAPYSRPRDGLDPYELAASERLYGPLRRDYPDQGFWDRGFRCVLAPERAATAIHQEKR